MSSPASVIIDLSHTYSPGEKYQQFICWDPNVNEDQGWLTLQKDVLGPGGWDGSRFELRDYNFPNAEDSPPPTQSRDRVSPVYLQPSPAKKKRPYPTESAPSTTPLSSPAPQPIKRPTLPPPVVTAPIVKQQQMEPVKQEVIELNDEQYDGAVEEQQYTDTNQVGGYQGEEDQGVYQDQGGAMVPADESGWRTCKETGLKEQNTTRNGLNIQKEANISVEFVARRSTAPPRQLIMLKFTQD